MSGKMQGAHVHCTDAADAQCQNVPAVRPYRTVDAVVPAYNEAPRIAHVLQTLCAVAHIGTIWCVDDGSDDDTAQVAARVRAAVLSACKVAGHQDETRTPVTAACQAASSSAAARQNDAASTDMQQNALPARVPDFSVLHLGAHSGKSAAMRAGAHASDADLLLFLDADLTGLTPAHIEALLAPVLSGEADTSRALFHAGCISADAAHFCAPWLSGQRVTTRACALSALCPDAGYGAETLLEAEETRRAYRRVSVPWRGVSHVSQECKRGLRAGLIVRARMYACILACLRQMLRTPHNKKRPSRRQNVFSRKLYHTKRRTHSVRARAKRGDIS